MNESVCRLCLKTICGDLQTIRSSLRYTLDKLLLLKLNLSISKETVMCNDCKDNLQVFLNIKSACVYLKNRALPLTNVKDDYLNREEIDSTNNGKAAVESNDEITCWFCTKATGREGLVPLNESKENAFVVDMLNEHIPKLNLNNSEELLTCKTCHDSFQALLNFIIKCMNGEEKINKYIEIEGTDDQGQIELNNVQQFTFKLMLKDEIECFGVNEKGEGYDENRDVEAESKIKYEKQVYNVKSFIKTEDIDIKSEQSDGDSFQEPSTELSTDNGEIYPTYEIPLVRTIYKCEICKYETKCKSDLNRHSLFHKNPSEITMYKCEMCTYQTKQRRYLKEHMLIHKDPSEITMYRCKMCAYETRRKKDLTKHLRIHKNPVVYKCKLCRYVTKKEGFFNRHVLTHKNLSQIMSIKMTQKRCRTKNIPTHKKLSEVTMHHCQKCTYETKHKRHLISHMLTHKDPSEITMHKCKICAYETKQKRYLNGHLLVHNNPSEIKLYKCEMCSFVTKHKSSLNRHILTHTNSSAITTYKCEMCKYQTKYKSGLIRHFLTHKDPSEVTMYRCKICTYESKVKRDLNRHTLTHKNPSEVRMFKCEMCTYEAKYKSSLKSHMLIHNKSSVPTVYECEICTYKTKYKSDLRRHMLTHKNSSEVDEQVQMCI